ncbi:unnamed protein product [Arctogadus glacialis]
MRDCPGVHLGFPRLVHSRVYCRSSFSGKKPQVLYDQVSMKDSSKLITTDGAHKKKSQKKTCHLNSEHGKGGAGTGLTLRARRDGAEEHAWCQRREVKLWASFTHCFVGHLQLTPLIPTRGWSS